MARKVSLAGSTVDARTGTPYVIHQSHLRRKATGRPAVDFAESTEHEMLRAAVRDLAAQFGHEYFAEQVRTGGKTDELWQAIADHGFLCVHLPPEYGGGGGGISELTIVCEELAAQGCPLLLILVSAAICAELIARFGTDAQKQQLAARARGRREDGVRDHRARRRLEHATGSPPPRRATATCTA